MLILINFFEEPKQEIVLQEGHYNTYISGGYSVNLGLQFRVVIQNSGSSEKIVLNPSRRIRNEIKGKRVVRILSFHIQSSGNYTITVKGFEDIVVKKSMLLLSNLVRKSPDRSEILLLIEKS